MVMQRRTFFKLIAGAMLAPVIAQAEGLTGEIFTGPLLWGDGAHDDTEALNALMRGEVVEFADPRMAEGAGWSDDRTFRMPQGVFLMTAPLVLHDPRPEDQRIGEENRVFYFGHGSEILMAHEQGGVTLDTSFVTIAYWTFRHIFPDFGYFQEFESSLRIYGSGQSVGFS
jgi:hypothetical protein